MANERKYDRDEVLSALNKAAEGILDHIGQRGGRTALIHLVVDAGVYYLDFPEDDLRDAIEGTYSGTSADDVLAWITDLR